MLPADFLKDIIIGNAPNRILGSVPQELQNNETNIDLAYISNIFQSISYTHFTELIKIEEPTKRRFYELVVLKTQPTVKELKRQIDTLTYQGKRIKTFRIGFLIHILLISC